MSKVKSYLSLIKFSHTIFAMPFALIGFFLGVIRYPGSIAHRNYLNKTIGWGWDITNFIWWKDNICTKLVLVILCMVFARSAAMAFNRYLDRNFDSKNPRTAIREIPSGIISANSALSFTVISSFLFIITCYFINRICFFLSPLALLVVLGYSLQKGLHLFVI
jgi:4-hydroxybenzoate polyprenyltransferase